MRGRAFFCLRFVPNSRQTKLNGYPDRMKELCLMFSDEEYAKLDDMRADEQSVEDFVRECLQTALPWIKWPMDGGYIPGWWDRGPHES